MNSIPAWGENGFLPPIRSSMDATSFKRSPYRATILEFIERFGTTSKRIYLLKNFLQYRATLNRVGLTDGFQWINGSFVEHVEFTRNRPPKDIDIVTFYTLPNGESQESLKNKNDTIFNSDYIKDTFSLDTYLIQQDGLPEKLQRECVTYWYSMWSHTRENIWKGFIELDLDASNDADALARLNELQEELQNA